MNIRAITFLVSILFCFHSAASTADCNLQDIFKKESENMRGFTSGDRTNLFIFRLFSQEVALPVRYVPDFDKEKATINSGNYNLNNSDFYCHKNTYIQGMATIGNISDCSYCNLDVSQANRLGLNMLEAKHKGKIVFELFRIDNSNDNSTFGVIYDDARYIWILDQNNDIPAIFFENLKS